jgi:hypothetical protein
MSYLTPFSLSLKPGEKNLYHTFVLNDEPGIPDDTYQLQEWYCPNPTCPCYEVSLKVYAVQQKVIATDLRLSLDPQQPIAPTLDIDDSCPIYAKKLFKLIEQELKSDPDYVQRLRDHYQHLKAVAADPAHPCQKALIEWGKTGRQNKPAPQKRKRNRR